MRMLIVGAGAVGGYFGGRLAEAGRDVTFLVRARRAQEIAERGLHIESPHGNVVLHPKVTTADKIDAPYDLILLSVKSYALQGAMDDFAPAVGPGTMIVPALNGMRHLEVLSERFGRTPVLGGVCRVAASLGAGGTIKQLATFQSLTYGELDGTRTPRLQTLDRALQGAGFEAAISDHILADMWQKWVQLAALGAINGLLRGSIGQVVAIPEGAELCLAILNECAEIAKSAGYPQSEAWLARLSADFTTKGSPVTSSMYRDLKQGLPVEVDTILGDLVREGIKRGLKPSLLQAAFVSLSIYQNELKAF